MVWVQDQLLYQMWSVGSCMVAARFLGIYLCRLACHMYATADSMSAGSCHSCHKPTKRDRDYIIVWNNCFCGVNMVLDVKHNYVIIINKDPQMENGASTFLVVDLKEEEDTYSLIPKSFLPQS